MKKAIILCHSQTGHTKELADKIKKKLGSLNCDISMFNETEFEKIESILEYDILALGCPTHGGKISAPFRKVVDSISKLDLKGKKLLPFSTCATENCQDMVCSEISKILENTGIKTVSSLGLIWEKQSMDDLIEERITEKIL